MRLHQLEMSAFGPFAGKEVINFDSLADAGLFLLNGETGAGKTSILDAVCFALYGSLPGARESMAKDRVRSDHASDDPANYQPTYVQCEFSVGARRLRVHRTPAVRRLKTRGTGYTTDQAKTLLEELRDGEWQALTNRNDEAGQQISALLGLARDQFTKLVMLPQGEFAAFLRSNATEKDAILRQLFDTRVFARVEDLLWEEYTSARVAIEQEDQRLLNEDARLHEVASSALNAFRQSRASAGIEDLGADESDGAPAHADDALPTLAEWAEQLAATVQLAKDWASTANKGYQEADAHVKSLKDQRADADAFEAWRQRQNRLAEQEENIAALRSALETDHEARAIQSVFQHREAAARTLAEAEASLAQARTAREASTAAQAAVAEHGGDLAAAVAALADQIAVLQERAKQEVTLKEQLKNRDAQSVALETLTARINELTEAHHQLVASVPDLEKNAETAAANVQSVEAATLTVTKAQDELAAAQKLAKTRAEIKSLTSRWQAASEATLDAQRHEQELTQTAQRQVAARLALQLQDHEPCPVCGALEHPNPATETEAPLVTDEEREAAAERSEASRAAETRAYQAVQAAQVRESQEAAQAKDKNVEDAQTALQSAQAAVQEAQRSVAEVESTSKVLKKAQDTVVATSLEVQKATSQQEAAQERLALVSQDIERLTTEVQADRGGFATITERVGELKATRTLLDHESVAERDHRQALKASEDAHLGWQAKREESSFESDDAFLGALLPENTRATYSAQTTAFADETSRVAELAVSEPIRRHRERMDAGEQLVSDEMLEAAAAKCNASVTLANLAVESRVKIMATRESFDADVSKNETARRVLEPKREQVQELEGLAKVARGEGDNRLRMRLSSFVLAAKLESVAASATVRLHEMSDGRYRLIHVDDKQGRGKGGLDLAVIDAWTGNQRDTNSLSGGETFMVSLSLALGLAEVIQHEAGGISLETLFVDEGFGTLDQASLEQVMSAIDDLREGGRVVGLVSHVEEMKQRIPAQIQVQKTTRGSTTQVVLDGAA